MGKTIKKSKQVAVEFDLREAILRHANKTLGYFWEELQQPEKFMAVALAVRDKMLDIALETEKRYRKTKGKRIVYLSLEFLMGRSLGNNLINLGMMDECREVLKDLGEDLDVLLEEERDAGLGNGGLGRLAACFLDSMATLGMPGYGYGINYEFGLFRQEIHNGHQVEKPDNWRPHGSPWEVERPDREIEVKLFGRVEHVRDENGNYKPKWVDTRTLMGVPYDMPVVGFGGQTVNVLRLVHARASDAFDMGIFNEGDYIRAVEQKVLSETVSRVLYPNDQPARGQVLRLIQEYFLVTCALHDIVRRLVDNKIQKLSDKIAIQLNDTHPALAVAELMRMLVDKYDCDWDEAWKTTTDTLAYTNHTLLPEALEKWPVHLLERVLPRHLQIIYEINHRFMQQVENRWPGDHQRKRSMSIIEEGDPQQVRMGHLAIIGCHAVNGVAEVHTKLVKSELVPDFYELWPEKFQNKTNGVTPRRWIRWANPDLSQLITSVVGDERWVTDLDHVRKLEKVADDMEIQERFLNVKYQDKQQLAKLVQQRCDIKLDCDSLFDIHIKRIHEYKRQLLNVLHIVHRYLQMVDHGRPPVHARSFLFAGKAAPGYARAKEIIYLIHAVANIINHDPRVEGQIKIAFVPDYNVSLAEVMIPAADLSEQISTAGFEASGTGNMKFAMNGALTIGTLDGANIEMLEEIGHDNMFIFGNDVMQIHMLHERGTHPRTFYSENPAAQAVVEAFRGDRFSPGEPGRFEWVCHAVADHWDPYFHLADFESYLVTQADAGRLYHDSNQWARRAILNIARMGKFSSDRTIKQYAREIWGIKPVL